MKHWGVWVLSFIFLNTTSVTVHSARPPLPPSPPPEVVGQVASVAGDVFLIRQGMKGPLSLKPGTPLYETDSINTLANGTAKVLLRDSTVIDISPSGLIKIASFKQAHPLSPPRTPASTSSTATGVSQSSGDSKVDNPERNVNVDIMYGKVRAAITKKVGPKSHFIMRTPTAVLGVRGTEFVVESSTLGVEASTAFQFKEGAKTIRIEDFKPGARTEITVIQGQLEVKPTLSPSIASQIASTQKALILNAGNQVITHTDRLMSTPVTLNSHELEKLTTESKVMDNTFQRAIQINITSGNSFSNLAPPLETLATVNDTNKNRAPASIPQSSASALNPASTFSLPAMVQAPSGTGNKRLTVTVTR